MRQERGVPGMLVLFECLSYTRHICVFAATKGLGRRDSAVCFLFLAFYVSDRGHDKEGKRKGSLVLGLDGFFRSRLYDPCNI
jgi:hypothetical protein